MSSEQVPYVEGHDLVVENETGNILPDEEKFLSLQRRAMLLPETSFKEEEEVEEDEDFFEEENDDDNDSFITINTSEDSGSDETLENSESNDSGVIEPEFMSSKTSSKTQRSYIGKIDPSQRSYGVNPIFAAQFNSQLERDSLDGNAVAASSEFKFVKNTKWKASKSKKMQKTRKFHQKDNSSKVIGSDDVGELSAVRGNETFAYNESCLI